jgi:hypothetical protein
LETPDNIVSWSDHQIEVEIASALHDLEFVCEWVRPVWSARIETSVPEGQKPSLIHAAESADRRMALLDVYGYLWLKEQRAPVRGSLWDPEQERPRQAPVRNIGPAVADPEDLDPDQIAAVYGIVHTD